MYYVGGVSKIFQIRLAIHYLFIYVFLVFNLSPKMDRGVDLNQENLHGVVDSKKTKWMNIK